MSNACCLHNCKLKNRDVSGSWLQRTRWICCKLRSRGMFPLASVEVRPGVHERHRHGKHVLAWSTMLTLCWSKLALLLTAQLPGLCYVVPVKMLLSRYHIQVVWTTTCEQIYSSLRSKNLWKRTGIDITYHEFFRILSKKHVFLSSVFASMLIYFLLCMQHPY